MKPFFILVVIILISSFSPDIYSQIYGLNCTIKISGEATGVETCGFRAKSDMMMEFDGL